MIDIIINEGPSFSLSDERARSLVSALAWVLEEPEVCRLRSTCTLYPQNKVVYHDEGAADPGVVVKVRE